jgi:hypothetical protein
VFERRLRLNCHRRLFINKVEQFDDVGIAHADAPVTVRCADLVLVLRSVNVDETSARVRVVLVCTIEPKNSRRDQVFGCGQRIIGSERHTTLENCSHWHAVTDFGRDAKIASGRFIAARFDAEAKPRRRNGVRPHRLVAMFESERLISNRNVDPGPETLHAGKGELKSACP